LYFYSVARIGVTIRVSDPYSFFPDPDPAFEAGDQSGSRALMTKNWKKITAEKKLNFFLSKTAIYLS
jgi:hypothetical protein